MLIGHIVAACSCALEKTGHNIHVSGLYPNNKAECIQQILGNNHCLLIGGS